MKTLAEVQAQKKEHEDRSIARLQSLLCSVKQHFAEQGFTWGVERSGSLYLDACFLLSLYNKITYKVHAMRGIDEALSTVWELQHFVKEMLPVLRERGL